MDNIINTLNNMFNELDWITNIKKVQNMLKIRTKEGLEYICKLEHKEKETIIIIKDLTLNFYSENKFLNNIIENKIHMKSIKDRIKLDMLKNELSLKCFKKGLIDFKQQNSIFTVNGILNDDKVNINSEIISYMEFLWNKGYEFSSKYPYPEEIEKQYNYIAKKTENILSIKELREFIEQNSEVNTYLDEKEISKNITSLNNFREINYSYKDIVAKTYIKTGRLSKKILIFDTEGINQIANCNINDYKKIYEEKIIENTFKNMYIYEKNRTEKSIGREKHENEQE